MPVLPIQNTPSKASTLDLVSSLNNFSSAKAQMLIEHLVAALSPNPSPSLLEKALYLLNVSRGSQPKLAPVTVSMLAIRYLIICAFHTFSLSTIADHHSQAMPQYLTSSSARRTLQATIEALGEEILEDMWFYIMYEM